MLEEDSSAYQFQFTPLREGRHQRCEASVFGKYFNSRPSARGDARHLVNARNGVHFNSRPSARGDSSARIRSDWLILFQFTPLREGRLYANALMAFDIEFQFTPLREGRLFPLLVKIGKQISIHAPPRGATCSFCARRSSENTFQFTPLREGRQNLVRYMRMHRNFNSRPSARGDNKEMYS